MYENCSSFSFHHIKILHHLITFLLQKDLQGIRDDLEGRVLNETSKLEKKIDFASNKLKVVGTNLTEQLQKLEMRDQDNWVRMYLYTKIDNAKYYIRGRPQMTSPQLCLFLRS